MRTPFYRSYFFFILLTSWEFAVVVHAASERLPNLDKRIGSRIPDLGLSTERAAAAEVLQKRIPGIRVELDDFLASPRFVHNSHGFLTGPDSEEEILRPKTVQMLAQPKVNPPDPNRQIKLFLDENEALFGYDSKILNNARVRREYATEHNGMRTIVWEQWLDGIPVFEAVLYGHITKNGELVSLCSQFVPNPAQAADVGVTNRERVQITPPVSAQEAVANAATNITETLQAGAVAAVDPEPAGSERKQRFTAPALQGDAIASLIWLPMDRNTMKLCWRVILTGKASGELFHVLIDAVSGEPQVRHAWTSHFGDVSYKIYKSDSPSPFSPGHATPNSNQPIDPNTLEPEFVEQSELLESSKRSSVASPNGWVNTDSLRFNFVNTTFGNNVDAHLDVDNINPIYDDPVNPPRPTGIEDPQTLNLQFHLTVNLEEPPIPEHQSDFPNGTSNQKAAVVNAFYWCNWMHDRLYELGFTEAAGNFQQDNFGRGGYDGDPVLLDIQNFANNPNVKLGGGYSASPNDADQLPARIELAVWKFADPWRDGALEADVLIHEYTHLMVLRRVGAGTSVGSVQAQALAEGWGDFFAIALLAEEGDDPSGSYPMMPYQTHLYASSVATP